MKIVTLGYCCKKSVKNHENVVVAAQNCGVEPPVNVSDAKEIVSYGIMMTPAGIIDGKAVSSGRALTVKEAEKLIRERL